MPKCCIIKSCGKLKSTKVNISYFRFPTNPVERNVWEEFVKTGNLRYPYKRDINPCSFLCSRHFLDCCFILNGRSRIIKQGHYPSVMVNGKGECIVVNAEHFRGTSLPLTFSTENTDTDDVEDMDTDVAPTSCTELETLKAKIRSLESENEKLKYELEWKNFRLCKSGRITRSLRKTISMKKEKPKKEVKTPKRSTVKRKTVSTQVRESNFESRNKYKEILTAILEREFQGKTSKYTPAVREFSLQLQYYSSKAYDFLRKFLDNHLPSPKALSSWTKLIQTKPGVFPDSMKFIKDQSQKSPSQIYYALSLDEISIRQQILYDGTKMKGYIDYGDIQHLVTKEVAKNALFVLATQVNGKQKIPIAYILTNGLTSELLTCIIKRCLDEMNKSDAVVLTISMDGLPANLRAAKELGADLDVKSWNFKTHFICPYSQRKIFIYPDPCHMLKLLRNTLESYKVLIDEDGNEIRWSYFQKLVELQKQQGLKLANKLSTRHVNFHQQKMKVNLAVQLLSSSSAVALEVCEEMNLYGFEGSSATAKFAKIADRVFDLLNSRPLGSGFKAPLAPWNYNIVKRFVEKSKYYLVHLRVKSTNELLVDSQRSTCITGLIACLTTIESLLEELEVEKSINLKYIPTYKLSQDPLELYFSSLRQRFGANNNPNAIQLEYALKRMLAVNISPNTEGNCVPQEEITTAAISPFRNLTDREVVWEEEEIEDFYDEVFLNEYVSNVVTYIAGFVGRAVLKLLDCKVCCLALIGEKDCQNSLPHFTLLKAKNNGGIFIPSLDLIRTCEETERAVRVFHGLGVEKLNRNQITNFTLQKLLDTGVFTELRNINTEEHATFGDHVLNLIKMIVKKYIKIRLHHIAKQSSYSISPTTCRSRMTKLVTFAGQ